MSARFLVLISALTLGTACGMARAQDTRPVEVENSKVAFAGEINSDAAYVRSGPSENYYPVIRLNKGAPVQVVGIKFDWLKIVPPPGSFSYIAKSLVEKTGASTGKVTRPAVNVRAGSDLVATKTTIQTQLEEGDSVQILGEQDEYYKIAPPAGAYLYVSKQLVTPIRPLAAGEVPEPTSQPVARHHRATTEPTETANVPPETTEQEPVVVHAAPPVAKSDFDRTEAEFREVVKQPIEEEPLADLVAKYEKLSNDETLSAAQKTAVEARLEFLKGRLDSQKDLADYKKVQTEANERLAKLKAEQEELNQRALQGGMRPYAALGKLETSDLQQDGQPLLRLTDPNTGRTLVYIKPRDAAVSLRVGSFVGVRGDIVTDQNLNIKIISPTWIEQIDPASVNKTATATIVPPSLMTTTGQ